MMTTITISTIAISVSGMILSMSVLSSILLIGFLAGREILQSGEMERHRLLSNSLIIGIIPLLIGFAVIVTMKILEILM